ncbi:hypothetical protein FN846DRAFT_494035 [Sphaerosporella brunnea]|uniref:Uncharacterized protein n=1 Tax=Sphaerosporella brunnea TaxID=1250544 RepID=A0A5J5F3Z3_9PEZI|nr:hypothetical protein FN846DRAFT_494035 [Sphaerosporella brunnea]
MARTDRPQAHSDPSRTTLWRRRRRAEAAAASNPVTQRPQTDAGPSRTTLWRRRKAQAGGASANPDTIMVDAPPLPRPPSSPSTEPAEPPECLQPSRPQQLPRRVDPLNPPTKETDYQRLQRRRIELADVLARAKSSWPRVKKGPNQRDIKEILLTDGESVECKDFGDN